MNILRKIGDYLAGHKNCEEPDCLKNTKVIERIKIPGYTYQHGFKGEEVTVPDREIIIFGYSDSQYGAPVSKET